MHNRMKKQVRISAAVAIAALSLSAVTASADFYQLDNGTADLGIGFNDGGEIAWMNVFEVDNAAPIITGISTVFGTTFGNPGVNPGDPFHVHLWGSDDGDPTSGMHHLGSWDALADSASIGTDVFQSVAIDPTDVSGFSHFVIGASVHHEPGTAPAPLDTSSPSPGLAWASVSVGGNWDPTNPDPLIDMDDFESGAWLLRASAVPAPGAILLLGLAAGFGRRRRTV